MSTATLEQPEAPALLPGPIPGPWSCSVEEYHADRKCESHTTLDEFRESIPSYHGKYVTGLIPRRDPSASMELGTLLHCAVLEPDRWNAGAVMAPDCEKRSKADKETWAKFYEKIAAEPGAFAITQAQLDRVQAMRHSIMSHPVAGEFIRADGITEQGARWFDQYTGIALKCRPDKRLDGGAMIDLKAMADPTPQQWSKDIANYGYHRQAALYIEGRWYGFDEPEKSFFFVVVGSTPPYECVVYQLTDRDLELGKRQNETTLIELVACRDNDEWPSRYGAVQETAMAPWGWAGEMT